MGERNSLYVFKGPTLDEFRAAAVSSVAELGGKLEWDVHPDPKRSQIWTSHNGCIHAAYIHWNEHRIAKAIGSQLAIPSINIRIQEGSLWEYSLYDGADSVDEFSTLPEYWDDDPAFRAARRGRLDVLANVWQIEQSAIENYLKPWGYEPNIEEGTFETTLRGKAYPGDQHEYGDIWQMTDFLRALGAHDPNSGEEQSIARQLVMPAEQTWWKFRKR
jgi:hypothetical protein